MNISKPDVNNEYLRHNDINNYLDYLGYRYPDFVNIYTIGETHEGRKIKAIKIDWYKKTNVNSIWYYNSINEDDREWVQALQKCDKEHYTLIEGGTHAREWTTVAVALHCIYQLTEKHCLNLDILRRMKFIIVPLVNADGYEYCHSVNRNWRKNRRPIPKTNFVGTDCNRNYDVHWQDGSKKASNNTYRGEVPFSEPETRAMRAVIDKLGNNLKFFISLHAYAQSIMYPWGYTKELPTTWKQLHYLAEYGKQAIESATGRRYRCGSISKISKRTYSGSVVDYVFDVQKVPYAVVMELPSCKMGFQPPKEKIGLIGTESWIGIKAMCGRIHEFLQPDVCCAGDGNEVIKPQKMCLNFKMNKKKCKSKY